MYLITQSGKYETTTGRIGNPDRWTPFWFLWRLDSDYYRVVACEPRLPEKSMPCVPSRNN